VRWVPGHSEVHGNEQVDAQAKRAAEGRHNNSPVGSLPNYLRLGNLPLSVSALKAAHSKLTQARWERIWRRSPRYTHMNRIDPKLLQRSF
ncbi:hypothetical protein DEU56DRAFT_695365, partial [Suillus clintonianus]|uniref:uncharacterized protein n=1 Tax=Suillus clintonianus TaxID=1904413 RepID=UPI001B87D218